MSIGANMNMWVPVVLGLSAGFLVALYALRGTPERRRAVMFFLLGFTTFAAYQLAAQYVVRYFSN